MEISRSKEVEKLHQESIQELQYVEEQKFRAQQESWRLRDLLSEHGVRADTAAAHGIVRLDPEPSLSCLHMPRDDRIISR